MSDISDLENRAFGEISEWELDVLKKLNEIPSRYPLPSIEWRLPLQDKWLTSGRVREELGSKSLQTRNTLKKLVGEGFVEDTNIDNANLFRISPKGNRALRYFDDKMAIRASDWTGLITLPQRERVLEIISEIEDVAEGVVENELRAQILGLVRAIEILLELPEPPRMGMIALVRDPAFSNIIQIGTFLAAIVAAVKA